MKKLIIIIMAFSFIAHVALAQTTKEKSVDKVKQAEESKYHDKIAKVFKKHCATAGCHRGNYPKKKLNLESDQFLEAVLNIPSIQIDTLKLVDTKMPQNSYLLMKVRGDEGIVDDRMPVEAPPMKQEEIELVEKWIVSISDEAMGVKKASPTQDEKKKILKKK